MDCDLAFLIDLNVWAVDGLKEGLVCPLHVLSHQQCLPDAGQTRSPLVLRLLTPQCG